MLRVDYLDEAKDELEAQGIESIAEKGMTDVPEAFYHLKAFGGVFTVLTEYEHPMLSE